MRLASFEPQYADTVAAWVTDPETAFCVAPRTAPPITAGAVQEWAGAADHAQVLLCEERAVAYGELNALDRRRGVWWLGHLIVDCAQRHRGVGRTLVRGLVERAFGECRARRLTLIVFPENRTAIRCYNAAGFSVDGFEMHYYPVYSRPVQMVRMVANWPRPLVAEPARQNHVRRWPADPGMRWFQSTSK